VLTLQATTGPVSPALGLRIEVASVVVRLALSYISREKGWAICDEAHDECCCLRVTDRIRRTDRRVDVLVTQDTPRRCQEALDAVLRGEARAVVLWDEPGALAATVDALQQGSSVIPERVIELAHEAPHLTDRQRQTLQMVSAGRSNADISAALCQSPSTTKRDLAELLDLFDAKNRAGLSAAASRLGYI
jgi:DNA-binding NarL/FixJ family response regulator